MENFANSVKELLRQHDHGVLSTFLHEDSKYPFGSLVGYDIHQSGDLIVKTALISEHYKNLAISPRASVFVIDEKNGAHQQANARATVLLDFHEVADTELHAVKDSYLKRFPNAIPPEIEQGFRYWRGRVVKVRWIAGFGSMGWVTAQEYYRP